MTVIERATERLAEEERQHNLGAVNSQDLAYWAAYLDGAKAQKKEDDAAVAAVQEIKPINPHGELREMLIDAQIDREAEYERGKRDAVVYGEWIEHKNADIVNGCLVPNYECSACHYWNDKKTDYCPNCGAKMDGKEKADAID